jgi:hypothetical protein
MIEELGIWIVALAQLGEAEVVGFVISDVTLHFAGSEGLGAGWALDERGDHLTATVFVPVESHGQSGGGPIGPVVKRSTPPVESSQGMRSSPSSTPISVQSPSVSGAS